MDAKDCKVGHGEGAGHKTVIKLQKIDALLREYESKSQKHPKQVHDGDWVTVAEICGSMDCSHSTALKWLRRCLAAGLVEVGRKRITKIDGATYPVTAYRFKKVE